MRYFHELWADTRRVLTAAPDALIIASVASLAFILGRYLRFDFSWLDPQYRGAGTYVARGLVYLVVPLLSLPLLRLSPAATGFSLRSPGRWLRDIGLLYALMLPLVVWAAFQPSFQRAYPYFGFARAGLVAFALGLGVRFVGMFCWEFILRGYLLFGLERRIGAAAAVAVQTIPFAILHFGKPLPETLGSIVAGVALGILALRNRSFIPGAILHFAVAATLDALAILI
ncbi:MAG: CPBP family intramembrane glutamic endopeptidase [bacterium]